MAGKGGVLAGLDLSLKLTPDQEAARLTAAQDRLLHLRLVLGGQIGDDPQLGPPVCVVFEGWDASGKGGAIKRLVAPLLTAEDWRNREKRRQYKAAVEEMLDRTDHAVAPWVLVEAEDKRWARVKVAESVVEAIEAGMTARNLPVPPTPADRRYR